MPPQLEFFHGATKNWVAGHESQRLSGARKSRATRHRPPAQRGAPVRASSAAWPKPAGITHLGADRGRCSPLPRRGPPCRGARPKPHSPTIYFGEVRFLDLCVGRGATRRGAWPRGQKKPPTFIKTSVLPPSPRFSHGTLRLLRLRRLALRRPLIALRVSAPLPHPAAPGGHQRRLARAHGVPLASGKGPASPRGG